MVPYFVLRIALCIVSRVTAMTIPWSTPAPPPTPVLAPVPALAPAPAPALARDASRRKLRVELVPPIIYTDANHEQDFVMCGDSCAISPHDFDIMHNGELSQNVRCMASRVSPSSVRLRKMDHVDGCLGVLGPPIYKGDTTDERLSEFLSAKVPVMLHNELAWVRITSIDAETGEQIWQRTLPYLLDRAHFPPRAMTSDWIQRSDMIVESSISFDEIAREEPCFAGDAKELALWTEDKSIRVQLTIETVTNKATGGPLTFYVNRVHALRRIAIITDAEMLP
jgi:hypothetical protein